MADVETAEAGSTPPPAETSPGRSVLIKQAVFVFLVACICGAWLQINPGFMPYGKGENETVWSWQRNEGALRGDTPYHIKYAYLLRTGAIGDAGEDFHWTRLSIWNGNFSDKDFLYHVYLVPFTLGAEDEFHWQALMNGAKFATIIGWGIFGLCLFASLRMLGVRRAWLATLACGALMGSLMAYRMAEPRSWLFGVCMAILGWGALSRGSRKAVFVIAVFYVLAYTGSHLLLAMALFRLVFRQVWRLGSGSFSGTEKVPDPLPSRRRLLIEDLQLTGLVLAGLILGWLIHPGSFALLKIWWVQNVLVPWGHGGGGVIGAISGALLGWPEGAQLPAVPPDMSGIEMLPYGLGKLGAGATFMLAAPIALPIASLALKQKPSATTFATCVIAVGFIVLTFRNGRFLEYAVPFTLLASMCWLHGLIATERVQTALKKTPPRKLVGITSAALAVVLCINLIVAGNEIGYLPRAYYEEAGVWMQSHDEMKGKVVWNHGWDSFPELFMFRSDCDYIWGMDPMFTAALANEDGQRVIEFMDGRLDHWGGNPRTAFYIMREQYGVDYVFFRDDMKDRAMLRQVDSWADAGLLQRRYYDERLGFALYELPRN
ncbi:MAG: hypothetical protein H6839_11260 [Planctomycetes bacterium]|nr:hypothetical protein [Planctomycetota bacterium]